MESLSDIMFHAEGTVLPGILADRGDEFKVWIYKLVEQEAKRLVTLNFIFCSDDYLHNINVQYLQHDEYTDIITFDNSEDQKDIEGDIFISLDRVGENSENFEVCPDQELKRVMSHGVLHLCGYKDKHEAEIDIMRDKENSALDLSSKYIL